jgi:hypothetical protein
MASTRAMTSNTHRKAVDARRDREAIHDDVVRPGRERYREDSVDATRPTVIAGRHGVGAVTSIGRAIVDVYPRVIIGTASVKRVVAGDGSLERPPARAKASALRESETTCE